MNDQNQTAERASAQSEYIELPVYISHKLVRAAKILAATLLAPVSGETQTEIRLEFDGLDGTPASVVVSTNWLITSTNTPNVEPVNERIDQAIGTAIGGYFVEYEGDGYSSWSPAQDFEEGYSRYPEAPPTNLPVGLSRSEVGLDDEGLIELRELVAYDIREHSHLTVSAMGEAGHGGGYRTYVIEAKDSTNILGMINFQEGPIGEVGVNGISHESLIAVLIDRLRCFQASDYRCHENKMAEHYLQQALDQFHIRTQARMERGVEGTHTV